MVVCIWGIFVQSLFSCPRNGRSPPLFMIRWKNGKKMVEDPSLSVLKVVIDQEEPLLGIRFDNHSLVDNSLGVKHDSLDYICVWWPVFWFIAFYGKSRMTNEWCHCTRAAEIDIILYSKKSIFLIFWVITTGLSFDVEKGVHRKMYNPLLWLAKI